MKLTERIKDGEEFMSKIGIKERYSLENLTKSEGVTVEEFLENNRLREEYKQKCIKSFIDNGMDREGAELQTMRKMNGCG
jgi:hypothetical protein